MHARACNGMHTYSTRTDTKINMHANLFKLSFGCFFAEIKKQPENLKGFFMNISSCIYQSNWLLLDISPCSYQCAWLQLGIGFLSY